LKKYGFRVAEIEDFSELEGKRKEIKEGMILADVEIETLEKSPFLRKWTDRFVLMSPLVTEDLALRLKKLGIRHVIKKPVEPRFLRKIIRDFSFPEKTEISSPGKKREGSRFSQKGGDTT
jgi:hypothetical protein